MKLISETNALERLAEIRERFRREVVAKFEFRAKDCSTCETKGVCCTDEHFVNVRITRLEAKAMTRVIDRLDDDSRSKVLRRIADAVRTLGNASEFFACPLFDVRFGCLVHADAKPMPCIFHACYDRPEDLPPERLLEEAEIAVAGLNKRTYGSYRSPMPIPAALALELSVNSTGEASRRAPSSDIASEQK
jgi:hypothetical protein